MDKGYSEKLDEIERLIKEGNTEDALDYLESMNWHKIHNINALLRAAKIYENADRIEDSKALLLFAHERSPIGRTVLFHLALVCIKMGELDEAKEYYDEFVEIAPHDTQKYIIKYQLNKAKGADDYALINILEELIDREFIEEKWAYELAYLYHRTGQSDKCIELCDKICLYFGDGPYVERALELKMLYAPLDSVQEEKYRSFQIRNSGMTEVKANEFLNSGEIVSHNLAIPKVELKADRFNTINLQAEIKKNIDEIMQATEAGEIDENMEAIKDLVEEIPYLQIPDESLKEQERKANESLDEALDGIFQDYLVNEYDGQMSLFLPEEQEVEEQIAGQMTIEEVMENWEKTKRAAEATLQEAEEKKLENAKAAALREANTIMDRLNDVIPKLDDGVPPAEILKEAYLSKEAEPETEPELESVEMKELTEAEPEPESVGMKELTEAEPESESAEMKELTEAEPADMQELTVTEPENEAAESEELAEEFVAESEDSETENIIDEDQPTGPAIEIIDEKPVAGFEIPRIDGGVVAGVGLTIPVVSAAGANVIKNAEIEIPSIQKSGVSLGDTQTWTPPVLGTEGNASTVSTETYSKNNPASDMEDQFAEDEMTSSESDIPAFNSMEASKIIESVNNMLQKEIDKLYEDQPTPEALPPVDIPADLIQPDPEEAAALMPETASPADLGIGLSLTDAIEQQALSEEGNAGEPTITEIKKDVAEEKIVQAVTEDALEQALEDDLPPMVLTAEEKELFEYFLPISGMEKSICQILTGARQRLASSTDSTTGNIIIQGGKGSGKTSMATSFIKVLQSSIGKPNDTVGRISAEKLNEKDIQSLLEKIKGGSLIIEDAGGLSHETTVTMTLLMKSDRSGTLFILEDTRIGIDRLKKTNPQFMKMFTERIQIPVFTVDELVNFGRTYARQEGYNIDEVGILALYDRIGNIQRFDRPTYLSEVQDIVDAAIDRAERGGLGGFLGRLGSKRIDEDGNLILMEKDFQE